jgi:hypothetical protein
MDETADAASEWLSAFTVRYPDRLPEAADDTTNGEKIDHRGRRRGRGEVLGSEIPAICRANSDRTVQRRGLTPPPMGE